MQISRVVLVYDVKINQLGRKNLAVRFDIYQIGGSSQNPGRWLRRRSARSARGLRSKPCSFQGQQKRSAAAITGRDALPPVLRFVIPRQRFVHVSQVSIFLLHGRLRMLHHPPALPGDASASDHHQLARTERRRLKIIPNAFGEQAALNLLFVSLISFAERWRSVKSAASSNACQLAAVRKELDQKYETWRTR